MYHGYPSCGPYADGVIRQLSCKQEVASNTPIDLSLKTAYTSSPSHENLGHPQSCLGKVACHPHLEGLIWEWIYNFIFIYLFILTVEAVPTRPAPLPRNAVHPDSQCSSNYGPGLKLRCTCRYPWLCDYAFGALCIPAKDVEV